MKQKWAVKDFNESKAGDPMVVTNCKEAFDPDAPAWNGEDPRNESELKDFIKCESFLCSRNCSFRHIIDKDRNE